jgi:hypothetical protein
MLSEILVDGATESKARRMASGIWGRDIECADLRC